MEYSTNGLIADFENCQTSAQVWARFLEFIQAHGFKCATYAYNYAPLNEPIEESEDSLRVAHAGHTWITNMPKGIVEEYQSQHYEKIDPMVLHIATRSMQTLPMARCQLDKQDPNYDSFDFILGRAEAYGIFSAIGIPLMHPFGRGHGQVTLHSGDAYEAMAPLFEQHGNKLHLAILYMHTFYQPLERKERAEKYGIKGRPLEVLQLLNAGFTNNQIALRLGVSAPTVSFHIKELRDSLRVTSTREILPCALKLGILDD